MIGELASALREPASWNPVRNGWALFGLLWGLPIPAFGAFLHGWIARSVADIAAAWPLHLVFLLHPPLFMLVFGAVGTLQRRRRDEIERLARTDGLTGIANYRALRERLAAEAERAARTGEPLACALLDLDAFKPINDRLGHAAGDAVLREIARRLDAERREYDVVARYGGDEFVFLLPATGREAALKFAARILDAVRRPVPLEGEGAVTVSASVGIAVIPDDARTDTGLLVAADRAMYAAKVHGRDRAVAAS
jgi:diguanylate cyclase (GGDEF)-like protein